MAVAAAVTLGGCGLAGWILAQVLRLAGTALEVLIESAESAARTNELIEQHLLPALGRIGTVLEESSRPCGPSTGIATADGGLAALRDELATAQAAGRVVRALDLRDAMTRHLRGDSLRDLDRSLAIWLLKLVERRVETGKVDAEVAGWVARALDSLGTMREAEPLRQALPSLRRQAGLCVRCGRSLPDATRSTDLTCTACGLELAAGRSRRAARSNLTREQP
jgi:hypothetical protein